MRLYRTDANTKVITSTVLRTLAADDGSVFVQTRNSVYRFESLGDPIAEVLPRVSRLR